MENQYENLVALATKNVADIVNIALQHDDSQRALVIYDTENDLTKILTAAYRSVLPKAVFLDFASITKEGIIESIDALSPKDLVVLIQSTDFRLNEFRIRIHLFKNKLKVIDHSHLYRNTPESWETYINSLSYDPRWYRVTGQKLKQVLCTGDTVRFES